MTQEDITDKGIENMTDHQLYRVVAKVIEETWADEPKRQEFLARLVAESERRELG